MKIFKFATNYKKKKKKIVSLDLHGKIIIFSECESLIDIS